MARSKKTTRQLNTNSDVINLEEARSKRHAQREAKRKKKFKIKAKKRKTIEPSEGEDVADQIGTSEFSKTRKTKKNKKQKRPKKVKKELSPRKKKQRKKRLILSAVIVVVFIAVLGASIFEIIDLKNQQRKLKQEAVKLTEQKEKLEEEAKNKDNLDYIEQQARKQLRLIMPGEILYVMPDGEKEEE
ncbi:MAG: septum formation initiator family protein [Anaerovoracaceae bacterium]